MSPLYTMLLCLPAGLALLIAVCGVAVLGPPPAKATPPHLGQRAECGRAGHHLDGHSNALERHPVTLPQTLLTPLPSLLQEPAPKTSSLSDQLHALQQ